MLITKEIEIDMGHRVPNHKSKCSNPHGHRYKIEVGVNDKVITTPGSSDEGMVIDFGDLKQIMMQEIDAVYDHSFMIWTGDEFAESFKHMYDKGKKINFVSFIPTAENIAKFFYDLIEVKLRERNISLQYVKIFETPTSSAVYNKHDSRSISF